MSTVVQSVSRWRTWVLAARPKTLIASVSPVVIGSVMAFDAGFFDPLVLLFTLLTTLGIQVGTNFANDYFDFLKGADTSSRKGPLRITQAGLVSLSLMKRAIIITFALTTLFGLYLIVKGGFVIVKGGFVIASLLSLSLLLGIIYTAGPYPIAYVGLGEFFVFLFFGPIAVAGTYYLQTLACSGSALLAGIAPGALSSAILIVNNIRDIEEDRIAKKKTLPVRLGLQFGRWEYASMLMIAVTSLVLFHQSHPFCLVAALTALPACFLILNIFQIKEPTHYNSLLQKTARLLLLFTLLFSLGWVL